MSLDLRALGEIPHVDGDLATHLIGTFGLLREWRNPDAVCMAGLYHAAYGTDGFAHALFDRRERPIVGELLGHEVEALIYLYAACDRAYTYARVDPERGAIGYRDRFDGTTRQLAADEAGALLELTLANELEIALRSQDFLTRHRTSLLELFPRFRPFVSPSGFACFTALFGYES